MANVNIKLAYKDAAWFTANPTIVLLIGQIVYLEQTGTYKIGDGITALSALSFLGNSSSGVQSVTGAQVDNTDPLNPVVNKQTNLVSLDDNTFVSVNNNLIEIKADNGLDTIAIAVTPTTFTKNGVEVATVNDIPTKTSDLTNDGDDGNPFISLNDLPSNIILYPTTVASAIPGYFKSVSSIVDPDYNVTAVDVSTGTITTTSQLITSLSAPIGLIIGNPGIFNITTIGQIKRMSGSGTASFYFEVYKRTSAGVETLIGTSTNTLPVDLSTYVEFSASAIWNDGIFAPTDLPVLKFYANRIAGGSDPVFNFLFGGAAPTRTLVPVPLSVTSIASTDVESNQTITGTSIVLPNTPTFIYGVFMNGQRLTTTTDYSITGATITLVNAASSDLFTITYKY